MARLARAHRRTRHALAELGDLVEALHAELLLLRLGQPAAEEVDVALPQPNEPCAKRTPELGTCDEVAGCEIVLSLLDRIDAVIAHARPERLTSLPDWTTPPAAE